MRWLCTLLLLLVAFTAVSCNRCQANSDAIAELESKQGKVDRDFAAKLGTWQIAQMKDEFAIGDGVRTAGDGRATLGLTDGSKLRLGSSTLIRFLERASGSNAKHIDVEMGEAELQTGDQALELQTEVGLARIDAGSTVKLRRKSQSTRFEVAIGSARFDTRDGPTQVKAGEGIEIGIGRAVIERFPIAGNEAPDAGAATAPPPITTAAAPQEPGGISADVSGSGKFRAPGTKEFVDLPQGKSQISPGTTLRLGNGTTAVVRQGDEQATLEGAGEFVVGGGDSLVNTRGGSVTVHDSPGTVTVTVPGGNIVVDGGSRANMRVGSNSTTVNVESGTVTIKNDDGTQTLHTGEEASIDRKGGFKLTHGRGPAVADIILGAGDSAVIHDPHPPIAVGFPLGSLCPRGGIVELLSGRGSSAGEGTVNIAVPAGNNRYRIRCIGAAGSDTKATKQGTLSILRDAGTRNLPRTPPATQIDTDGRNYTVLYQNQLPKLSVRWPNAPPGSSFALQVTSSGGRAKTLQTGAPTYSFAPGALAEGDHQLTFEGGGKKSKVTTLSIRFDNAAPTASLTSPAEGSFSPGSSVLVSGTALPGWSVFVGGQELGLDDQQRFSAQVAAPAGQRALAIRFTHPQRGVHVYVRRAAGNP